MKAADIRARFNRVYGEPEPFAYTSLKPNSILHAKEQDWKISVLTEVVSDILLYLEELESQQEREPIR